MKNFLLSLTLLEILQKIKKKLNIQNKYIEPIKIRNSIVISKTIKNLFNIENDFINIIVFYIRQLNSKKYNYITLLLFLKFIDNKFINKFSKKNYYYKIMYILSISRILYRWSYKDRCDEIPKTLLNFLDKATGLDKSTIESLRNDMTEKGWIQKSTSNGNNKLIPLLYNSIPKSILYVSKVIFYNEIIKMILIKIITGKLKNFNFKNKILNIAFLTGVLQFPIFMVSLYNYFFKFKPNKFMITIWTMLSATPIFITNYNQSRIVSIFSQATLFNNYLDSINFKLPNIAILYYLINNLVNNNLKNKLNRYIYL